MLWQCHDHIDLSGPMLIWQGEVEHDTFLTFILTH